MTVDFKDVFVGCVIRLPSGVLAAKHTAAKRGANVVLADGREGVCSRRCQVEIVCPAMKLMRGALRHYEAQGAEK